MLDREVRRDGPGAHALDLATTAILKVKPAASRVSAHTAVVKKAHWIPVGTSLSRHAPLPLLVLESAPLRSSGEEGAAVECDEKEAPGSHPAVVGTFTGHVRRG